MKTLYSELCVLLFLSQSFSYGQNPAQPSQDVVPYGRTTPADVKVVMDRVLNYVDKATPVGIINRVTGEAIVDLTNPVKEATLAKSEYNIASHEWGLAYTSMLLAGEATGDRRYIDYVSDRFEFLGEASKYFRDYQKGFPSEVNPLQHFLNP